MADKYIASDENEKSELEHTPDRLNEEISTTNINEEFVQSVDSKSIESKINQWKNEESSLEDVVDSQMNQSEAPTELLEEDAVTVEEETPKEITIDAVDELLSNHTGHEEFSKKSTGIDFDSVASSSQWQEPRVQPTASEMNHPGYDGNYGPTYGPGEIPYEIKGWNWGAFSFNIIWGIGNKTYLPLLCLIPIFNVVWFFVCGAKGNEWAWQSGNYRSVEEFKQVQKTWNIAGIAKFVWSIVVFIFAIMMIPAIIGFTSLFITSLTSQYDYEFNSRYSENYDGYYDDEYVYSDIEISDIGKWTEDIFEHIQVADMEYDLKTDDDTYKNGTKYEELLKLVGDPVSTFNYGDEIEATWDTTLNQDSSYEYDYAYITVNYDKKTGFIIDKFFSEE